MTEVLHEAGKELVHVPALVELDARESDSISVRLLYQRTGNIVLIHLLDQKEGVEQQFQVPSDKALDAFNHPYAFAPETLWGYPDAA